LKTIALILGLIVLALAHNPARGQAFDNRPAAPIMLRSAQAPVPALAVEDAYTRLAARISRLEAAAARPVPADPKLTARIAVLEQLVADREKQIEALGIRVDRTTDRLLQLGPAPEPEPPPGPPPGPPSAKP
jgi:hypothetical protein